MHSISLYMYETLWAKYKIGVVLSVIDGNYLWFGWILPRKLSVSLICLYFHFAYKNHLKCQRMKRITSMRCVTHSDYFHVYIVNKTCELCIVFEKNGEIVNDRVMKMWVWWIIPFLLFITPEFRSVTFWWYFWNDSHLLQIDCVRETARIFVDIILFFEESTIYFSLEFFSLWALPSENLNFSRIIPYASTFHGELSALVWCTST